ncbi:MAG: hypothetical protein ABII25_08495 [bacterium]
MKTVISIPNNLFRNAEMAARKLKMSRSRMFSEAIEEYLENHTQSQIMEKLNLVYTTEKSKLDNSILRMQIQSIDKEEW